MLDLHESGNIHALRRELIKASAALTTIVRSLTGITDRVDKLERAIRWHPITRFNLQMSPEMVESKPYTPTSLSLAASPTSTEIAEAEMDLNIVDRT